MIVSAINKRQVDQRKHSFLEKKISIKRKMDSLWTPRNIALLYGSCYKTIDSSISQNLFSQIFFIKLIFIKFYLKTFSMQCRKNITVEDNTKGMNIANFINIYTNVYI